MSVNPKHPLPSLRSWILLGVVCSALLPLMLTVGLIGDFMDKRARQGILAELRQQGELFAEGVNLRLLERLDDLTVLLNLMIETGDVMGPNNNVYAFLRRNNPDLLWIVRLNHQGRVVRASHDFLLGQTLADWSVQTVPAVFGPMDEWLAEPAKLGSDDSWEELRLYLPTPELAAGGGLMAGVDLEALSWVASGLLSHGAVPSHTELFLIDGQGKIVVSSRISRETHLPAGLIVELLAAHNPSEPIVWDRQHEPWFTEILPMPAHGVLQMPDWYIVVRRPASVALGELTKLRDDIVLVSLLAMGLLIWLAVILSRRLSAPLSTLAAAIDDPSTAAIPIVSGYHEVGLLSHALRQMRRNEQAQHQALADLNASLEQQVLSRTEELHSILQHATNAYISLNPQGQVISWNHRAEQLFGWSAEERLGRPLPDDLLPPEMWHWIQGCLVQDAQARTVDTSLSVEAQIRPRQGNRIWIYLVGWLTPAGGLNRINLLVADISEQVRQREALLASQQRLETITNNLPALIAYIDREQRYRFCNATYADWYGWTSADMQDKRLDELFEGEELAAILPHVHKALAGEVQKFERQHPGRGAVQHLISTYIPHRDEQGQVQGFYLLTLDISARKQLEVALQQMALQDALTGLPNRRAMMAQLPDAMARADRSGLPLALLFMDLDGFKGVNDRLGHDAGDEVLREFARRIRQQVREVDILYRLAGDEFTLLLENLHAAPDEAQAVGQKICRAMAPLFCLAAGEARLSTSIGIALYWPHQPREVEALVAAADQAMYTAKRAGKNGVRLAQE
ncbi:diguanylate cyclase domain-containing protein [Pseudaeromonas paramecii]|uniref:Diguanylate cyclase n=1 Tax=Pseudaeromonas paramecii TaxID=2138166 RepID=A0ABP8PV69_9GAMM